MAARTLLCHGDELPRPVSPVIGEYVGYVAEQVAGILRWSRGSAAAEEARRRIIAEHRPKLELKPALKPAPVPCTPAPATRRRRVRRPKKTAQLDLFGGEP